MKNCGEGGWMAFLETHNANGMTTGRLYGFRTNTCVYGCVGHGMWQGSGLGMDIWNFRSEMPVGLWCGNGDKICSKFANMKAGVRIDCLHIQMWKNYKWEGCRKT